MTKAKINSFASHEAPVAVRVDETDNFQRKPCKNCPWRTDVEKGEFTVDDFRRLAHTAYDMDYRIFTCHKSQEDKPMVCAGFLLRGAAHNLTVRLNYGHACSQVQDGGYPLYPNYRAMAVANGVDEDDPVLARCRGEN